MPCGCVERAKRWKKKQDALKARGAARRAAAVGLALKTFETAGKVLGVKGEADEQQN